MNCSDVKYYLNDFSKGNLLDEIRAEIHEHLCGCMKCSKVFDDLITANSESKGKKKKHSVEEKILGEPPRANRKNQDSDKISSDEFSSSSTASDDFENLKNNLLLKANEIDNNKLFGIAGIISAIALGIIFAVLFFDHSPSAFWLVEKISGHPVIDSKAINEHGIIRTGEKLITDSKSKARIKIGSVGEIEVEPNTEIQIKETESFEYKLVLLEGKISARTWTAPKLFSIKTPSSAIKDLGCLYYISVDDKSVTTLQVISGWVLMENDHDKSLLPAGTTCYSDLSKGIGTPFADDASMLFKESLYKLDFQRSGELELENILSEARKEDLITLFHLLKKLKGDSRGKIYDCIASLFNIPPQINRNGIMDGDKEMFARLWTQLGLGSISVYQYL